MKHYSGNLTEQEIKDIANDIKIGKIVVFPTETVYGIGTNAYNEGACKKIYEIKRRPNWKALIVLISDYEQLKELVEEPSNTEKRLMSTFWPGALTIILKKKKETKLSKAISTSLETIGVRMTDGEIVRKLLMMSNVPIVAPSANLSGMSDGSKIDVIIDELGQEVDDIIDNGDINNPVPSTIVQVIDGKIKVLREGKITKKHLSEIAELE